MTRRVDELSWEQFRDRVPAKTDLVFVPVGTLEAHGAIPLGTDTLIPESLAADLAPRFDALVAPAIPYGVTNSLLPYPGSTRVSPPTFKAYLFEAAAGLVDAGFRRIVLLNGHGGQTEEVAEVTARLWNEKRAFAAAVEWWGMAEDASRAVYPGAVSGHAGVEETAMVLAVAPTLIDAARATTIRRAPRRAGIRSRPFPASIILDSPESASEGAPVLDARKAKTFRDRVVAEIETQLGQLFEGWAEIRR